MTIKIGYKAVLGVLLCLALNLYSVYSNGQGWEVHLNLRDINYLVNNDAASILIKKKMGDQTYFRLNVDGRLVSISNSGSSGFSSGPSSGYSVGLRPGLEKRTALSEKLFLVRGVDLIYQLGGTKQYPATPTNFQYNVYSHEAGVSPFIGLHYALSPHFAFLSEIHLQARHLWSKGEYVSQAPQVYRTDKSRVWNVNFLPFKYLTVAYTF